VMLLGDLMIWYYENMAGIKSNPEKPGFEQIIMKPDFNAGLTFVNASYESIHGLIKSNWKRNKSNLVWKITIPANTTALVYLPTTTVSDVKINNVKVSQSYQIENNKLVLELPSGTYEINANNIK
jgi:alpha-L-rhamnosidase